MSLRVLIENQIESGVFSTCNDGKIDCACGSKGLSRYSIRTHLKSKKHAKLSIEKKECGICYEDIPINTFFTCSTCKNSHCNACNKQITKCPFCRTVFRQPEAPPQDNRVFISMDVWSLRDNIYHLVNLASSNVQETQIYESLLEQIYQTILSNIEVFNRPDAEWLRNVVKEYFVNRIYWNNYYKAAEYLTALNLN